MIVIKIGKFAKESELTIDTVRYYIDTGLLIPNKNGGQYDFDHRCKEDIDYIMELKRLDFKLNEIKEIIDMKRFINQGLNEKNQYYKKMYTNKHIEIKNKLDKFLEIELRLRNKIESMSDIEDTRMEHTGIDMGVLNLLACPRCKKDLLLQEGQIKYNQVITGLLKCECGMSFKIESGIIISDNVRYMEHPFGDDTEKFFEMYLKGTDREFLNEAMKGINWSNSKLQESLSEDSVLLEVGVGYGAFLRNVYSMISKDNVYIAIDHNISILKALKDTLDKKGEDKRIVLICCDFSHIPLKNNSVDILLDIISNAENRNIFNCTQKIMKEKSSILGNYVITNRETEERMRFGIYTRKTILEYSKKLNYEIIEEQVSKEISGFGEYGFKLYNHEVINNYCILGKRWS